MSAKLRHLLLALFGAALIAVAWPGSALATSTVTVQGGTTIRDSGLLANVLIPGFQSAYPQYTLTFVAVGTTQALVNAENGLGDAVFTHAPDAEAQFVDDGWSLEPYGRLVMYSDFVTVGDSSDPAGVHAGAPHNAVNAFKLIAAAGANGTADFVSRGDGSGTNLKELQIWALTGLPLNTLGEPGTPGTTTDAPWYHKAGAGQASTLQVASQCTFSSGKCYALADRGTFNYLQDGNPSSTPPALPTLLNMSILSQHNTQPAPGGPGLLDNIYHAYAVNPAKNPAVNLAGAQAFIDYVQSPQFQAAVAAWPSASQPTFFPAARPLISLTNTLNSNVTAGSSRTISGTVSEVVPFSPALVGATVQLVREGGTGVVASDATNVSGGFSITWKPNRTGTYDIVVPQFQDMTGTSLVVGSLTVTAKTTLALVSKSGRTLKLKGTAAPATGRIAAAITIQVKRPTATTWTTLKTVPLAQGVKNWASSITLSASGKWNVRAQYTDTGAVSPGVSPSLSVSVS